MQALSDGQQVERLEGQVGDLGDRIDRVEAKIDDRINGVEDKMEKVRAESRADFRVLLGVILTTFLTLLIQHL